MMTIGFRFVLLLALILALLPGSTFATGNDLLTGDLRHDDPSIYQSDDYIAFVWDAGYKPTANATGDFTTGWLGLNLGPGGGQPQVFTQVGLYNDSVGVHWFVYSEAPTTCLRGHSAFEGTGCISDPNDWGVTAGAWSRVELVTYNQGFWIARVYDQNSIATDVANFASGSNRVYRIQQTGEEAFNEATDPQWVLDFFHWHPQYMIWGTGFTDWPASSGGNNNVFFPFSTQGISICPTPYGGSLNYSGDPRF